eukprot:6006346-Karenia_brevis.AAC.1
MNYESLEPSKEELPGMKQLPAVDICKDPGIWICLDEGCNSNCHGKSWAVNTVEKLQKCRIKQKFD